MSATELWLPLLAGGSAWLTTRCLVPTLPEPPDAHQDGWTKTPYSQLSDASGQWLSCLTGAAAGLVASGQPLWQAPLLLVLAGPTAALTLVDLRTTWLPLPLTRLCWALALPACALTVSLSGKALLPSLLAVVGAALLTGATFWLLWRLGLGLGFGDVRLAPLLALGTASWSWQAWWLGLLLGSLLGALWGLATAAWRRFRPHPMGSTFAYGPSLWLGAWLALALT
ncbi:hypothetical protein [Luteococcus sp. OSA5]|uniref:hypothetical protein n=1 Tax=Luteococcus sp. OSA5 TaxID=3401630 RepID=UPI003B436F39